MRSFQFELRINHFASLRSVSESGACSSDVDPNRGCYISPDEHNTVVNNSRLSVYLCRPDEI